MNVRFVTLTRFISSVREREATGSQSLALTIDMTRLSYNLAEAMFHTYWITLIVIPIYRRSFQGTLVTGYTHRHRL